MYEALITTIKEVYPDVYYENIEYAFPPYVIIPVVPFYILKGVSSWLQVDWKNPTTRQVEGL